MLGRYAHLGPLGRPARADRRPSQPRSSGATSAHLAERSVDSLSGGEWKRVRLARALAQEPRALVLDEPTASLDVRHEMELFELFRRLVDEGMAALVITHHLNLAARFADRILLLSGVGLVAEGTPAEVLTREIVGRVFEWPVAVTPWCDGSPQIVPLRPGEQDREPGGRPARDDAGDATPDGRPGSGSSARTGCRWLDGRARGCGGRAFGRRACHDCERRNVHSGRDHDRAG